MQTVQIWACCYNLYRLPQCQHAEDVNPFTPEANVCELFAGLAALTQPFKLRLARAEHEKQLKDYSHNVVLIEPLASMTAVEDFLWSKVYRSSASPPPSSRTGSGADEVTCAVDYFTWQLVLLLTG